MIGNIYAEVLVVSVFDSDCNDEDGDMLVGKIRLNVSEQRFEFKPERDIILEGDDLTQIAELTSWANKTLRGRVPDLRETVHPGAERPNEDPYEVIVSAVGCTECGRGKMYSVEGPDGVMISTEWPEDMEGEIEAQERAGELNMAFLQGVSKDEVDGVE